MQSNYFWKSGIHYPIAAFGAALLAAIVGAALYTALQLSTSGGFGDALHRTIGAVDGPLAIMITVASAIIFAGLWTVGPATKFGAFAVRGTIAFLVVLNLLAWGVAMWLN